MTRREPRDASGLRDYLRDLGATPLMTADEEAETARRVGRGDAEARDRMIRANLRLVVRIAHDYEGRGLGLEDLVAEGNLGLIRAVEGFDPERAIRFSTYASFWIKQSIRSALRKQSRVVRLPAYLEILLGKWRRASAALADRLGREPSNEEVGRELGVAPRTIGRVTEALRIARRADPSGPGAEGDALNVGDCADGRRQAPDEEASAAETLARLADGLGRLDPRAAAVVRLRFGLADRGPMTRDQVGHELGVTRECARQIERRALAAIAADLGPALGRASA